MRTAILFGATGLVGGHVLGELLDSRMYGEIIVYSRRPPELKSSIIKLVIAGLDDIGSHTDDIRGDDLFCCLGTTIRKAGTKEAFRKVDLEAPVKIASVAAANGIRNFIVVSSIGADASSSNFYLRTKGEMEKQVSAFKFEHLYFLRPSMLLGNRKEFRFAEKAAAFIMKPLGMLMTGRLKKYRAIEASRVAAAMVKIALHPYPSAILESDTIAGL